MKKSILIVGLILFASFVLLTSNATAGWYNASVTRVVPYADGSARVQILPGEGEDRFTGTARGEILAGDPGANKMLAVILTAISMTKEVSIWFTNDPSWEPVEQIKGVGLVVE